MSADLKDPINLPTIPWDKILKWSAISAFSVTLLGFIARNRTFIILSRAIDIVIVVGLLLLAVYAIIAKYSRKTPPDSKS